MSDATLTRRLETSFRLHANRPALRTTKVELTYGQLGRSARQYASCLREAGIARGDRVGIWMEKSPSAVAAVLGTLYAGATYVPLDPRAPQRRVGYIAGDCALAALITDSWRADNLGDLPTETPGLRFLIGATPEQAGRVPCRPLPDEDALGAETFESPEAGPEDPAYILYTSGSTGRPKGVVLSHRAALGFTDWSQRTFQLRPDDKVSSHAPFHFDLSIFDLHVSFLAGACVHLVTSTEAMLPPWLCRKIRDWGLTVWYSVPSALISMLEQGDLEQRGWPEMRIVLFAGEVFPTPNLRRVRRALPAVRLCNLYGPTETNVCTWHEVGDVPDEMTRSIPIGKVCDHLGSAVLDEKGNEVVPGEEGNLWISGDNLLTAYWNDPAMTDSRLKLRTGTSGDRYFYDTGDRVRTDENGDWVFLGRRDSMVKVRGYRVDLNEVERGLYEIPWLAEAAAVAVPDDQHGTRLAAWVSLKEGAPGGEVDIRSHLKELFPLYMVPERIQVVDILPRTSTGKVDRQALLLRARAESNPVAQPESAASLKKS